jgi:hypothetical protein
VFNDISLNHGSRGADEMPDYELQIRVRYEISVFVSVHHNKGVPKQGLGVIHSFSSLSYDKSKVSSKASSPLSAI